MKAGLLLLVAFIGILTMPNFLYEGDAAASREEARALLLTGTTDIAPDIAENVKFVQSGQFFVRHATNGSWHSKYGIMTSLLYVAPLWLEWKITGQMNPYGTDQTVLFIGLWFALIAVAIAWLLYDIAGFYTTRAVTRAAYVLMAFYTGYTWYYLRSGTSESLQMLAFCLLWLSYLRLKELPLPLTFAAKRAIFIGWIAVEMLCLTRVSYLFMIAIYAGMLLWQGRKKQFPAGGRFNALLCYCVLPALAIVALQGIVNAMKFGNPLLSGYHQWVDPLVKPAAVLLNDFMISGQWSFFICFPLLIVALFGLRHTAVARRDELVVLGSVCIVIFALSQHFTEGHGEWCYGPRYFVCLMPLLALPCIRVLDQLFTSRTGVMLTVVACLFCAAAQMQVNRLYYFYKYPLQNYPLVAGIPPVQHYFANTPYPLINWQHLQARGHWETLPYYADVQKKLSPPQLQDWNDVLELWTSRSNLYWQNSH